MISTVRAICAIEQEMKFISDSEEGSSQYRKGYMRALKIVREFLDCQKPDCTLSPTPSASEVGRLLSAVEEPELLHE